MVGRILVILALSTCLTACGKSDSELEREKSAQEAKWRADVAKTAADQEAETQGKVQVLLAQHAQQEAADRARAQKEQAESDAARVVEWKERVKLRLFDPESAQFRNIKFGFTQMCGEVNSRNKMGGYVGFRGFIVTNDEVVIDSEEGLEHEMYLRLSQQVVC